MIRIKSFFCRLSDVLHFISLKILVYMVIAIFALLAVLNIFVTAFFNSSYAEWTFFRADNLLLFIIFLVVVVILSLIIGKRVSLRKMNEKYLIVILMAYTFTVSVVWIMLSHSRPVADRLFVSEIAAEFIKGDYSAFRPGHYLYNYPYQLGITAFIELVYRVAGTGVYDAVRVLNAVAVCISFYAIYRITKLLFGGKISKLCLIMLAGCLCAMFFCTYVYGNLFGLAFASLAVWMELEYLEHGKIWKLVISCISISVALILKNNYSVVLISMIIMLLLDFLKKKEVLSLIFVFLMFFSTVLSANTLSAVYATRSGIDANEGVPMVSFIAMGLSDGWFGNGTYNRFTLDTYEEAGYEEDKAKDASMERIRGRLEYFGEDKLAGIAFFAEKMALEWTEPTYMSIWDSNCASNHDHELSAFAKSMYTGILHDITVGFMNLFQSLVWLCAAVYVIKKRNQLTPTQMFPALIITGGFLCHLLWEAKSQYMLQYFIFAIPYAAAGFREVSKTGKKWILALCRQ